MANRTISDAVIQKGLNLLKSGVRQSDVSSKLGVSLPTVSRWNKKLQAAGEFRKKRGYKRRVVAATKPTTDDLTFTWNVASSQQEAQIKELTSKLQLVQAQNDDFCQKLASLSLRHERLKQKFLKELELL